MNAFADNLKKENLKKMGKSWFAVVKKAFTPRPKQTKDEQVSTDPQTIFIIYTQMLGYYHVFNGFYYAFIRSHIRPRSGLVNPRSWMLPLLV